MMVAEKAEKLGVYSADSSVERLVKRKDTCVSGDAMVGLKVDMLVAGTVESQVAYLAV